MKNKNYARTFTEGSGILGVSTITVNIAGLLVGILLARALSPSDFGTLALALSIVQVFFYLLPLGFGLAISRYLSYYIGRNEPGKVKQLIKTGMITTVGGGLIFSGMLFMSAGTISAYFSSPSLAPLLRIFAISLPFFGIYQFGQNTSLGLQRYARSAIIENSVLMDGSITKNMYLYNSVIGSDCLIESSKRESRKHSFYIGDKSQVKIIEDKD